MPDVNIKVDKAITMIEKIEHFMLDMLKHK